MHGVVDNLRVKRSDPHDGQENVSLSSSIKVYFTQALDPATLTHGTFIVARNSFTPIPGKVTYEATPDGDFVGTFTPELSLEGQQTYQVILVGRAHPFSGGTSEVIRNIAGYPLGDNVTFTFSTSLVDVQPPIAETPIEYSSIVETRPVFSWSKIANADEYQIEIGKTSLMNPLFIPEDDDPVLIPQPTTPNVSFVASREFETDQQYYWRLRTRKGTVCSAWSVLHTFYIISEGAESPYIPPSQPAPYPGSQLLNVSTSFAMVSIDPQMAAIGDEPEYIRVVYNKEIDPDSINLDNIRIVGTKCLQSDPNTTEPGIVQIADAYPDPDEPNVLIIVPVGGTGPGGTGSAGGSQMTAADYWNLFRDIAQTSGYRRAFAKHFLDLTERIDADQLYTDVRNSRMRISRRAPYTPIGQERSTTFHVIAPNPAKKFEIQFRCSEPENTSLVLYISTLNEVYVHDGSWQYDPTNDVQIAYIETPVAGTEIKVKISMMTNDEQASPEIEWFAVLFNDEVV